MSLSNTTKTHLVDTQVFNNSRCEFRLPDGYLSSSIKLIDLGLYSTQITDTNGVYYPAIKGVLASIKKMTLFSDSLQLDQVEELAWASIQNLRTTNQGSEDINRFELRNGINLSISRNGEYDYQPEDKDYSQFDSGYTQRHNNQFQLSSTAIGNSGCVNLANYFEMLASLPVLPKIPNLRLLIEWNLTASDLYNDSGASGSAVANLAVLPMRPTLVVEELMGVDQEMKDVKLPYLQTIVERFRIDENGGAQLVNGTTYATSVRSGAFNGRYLKDVTFFNQSPYSVDWTLAKDWSPAMTGEVLQLIVNGRKYLPDQGINQEAMKLQYFNSTHGPLNIPFFNALPSITDLSGNLTTDNNPIGRYSVTAVEIESVIDRMEIEYRRTGNTAVNAQSYPFTLLCFGRCARILEIKNGKARLSY